MYCSSFWLVSSLCFVSAWVFSYFCFILKVSPVGLFIFNSTLCSFSVSSLLCGWAHLYLLPFHPWCIFSLCLFTKSLFFLLLLNSAATTLLCGKLFVLLAFLSVCTTLSQIKVPGVFLSAYRVFLWTFPIKPVLCKGLIPPQTLWNCETSASYHFCFILYSL